MDASLFLAINRSGVDELDAFMALVSELGKGEYAALIAGLLVLLLGRRIAWRPVVTVMCAALVAGTLAAGLKSLVDRPRPLSTLQAEVRVVGEELRRYSFPSGHTACAFALAMAMGRTLRRRAVWAGAFAAASLVGFSRIYVGAHYPGDVLGGLLVGVLCGDLVWRASEQMARWWLARTKAVS